MKSFLDQSFVITGGTSGLATAQAIIDACGEAQL